MLENAVRKLLNKNPQHRPGGLGACCWYLNGFYAVHFLRVYPWLPSTTHCLTVLQGCKAVKWLNAASHLILSITLRRNGSTLNKS